MIEDEEMVEPGEDFMDFVCCDAYSYASGEERLRIRESIRQTLLAVFEPMVLHARAMQAAFVRE